MNIEILLVMALVATAFGFVVTTDTPPPGPDFETEDFLISEKEYAVDYSNYTAEQNTKRMGNPVLGNVQCAFNGQFLPHPLCCYKYVRCERNTPTEMHCPAGTAWSSKNPPCDHDYKTSCGVSSNDCADGFDDCPQLAANGRCNEDRVYAACKTSCSCGIGSNPSCTNTDVICPILAAMRACISPFVHFRCRISCACEKNNGAPPVIPPPASCSCGIAENINRIVGGDEALSPRKYPWQVGLRAPGRDIFCGGSIVNNKYVLTAAHCLIADFSSCILNPRFFPIHVQVGDHHQHSTMDDDDMGNTKLIPVNPKRIFIHPCFDCNPDVGDYDFALLELEDTIEFNDVIKPVCLPKDDTKTYAGEYAKVAGWGHTAFQGSPSPTLQELDLTILDANNCGLWQAHQLTSNMLCAMAPNTWTKNTCHGDSGGPLVIEEPKGSSRYVQVGVVSKGKECIKPGFPAVFGRVSKVLDWIKAKSATGQYCAN